MLRATIIGLCLTLPLSAFAEDADAWRSQRPAVPPPATPKLPTFEKAQLSNGLTLLVTRVDALPVVTFNLVTKGGATYDPASKAGLTALTYDMLEEGAGDLDALAFSDAVADLGATFGARGDRDSASVSVGGLSKHADAMMGLLADAMLRPKMEAKAFERRKAQTVATLLRRRGNPQGLAFEKVPALIYGADHPFGHPSTGTPESVEPLTHADVTAHYAKIAGPKNSALIVAGALSLTQVQALAEKHLGAWASKASEPPVVPAVAPTKRERIVLIDKPGAAQTMMVVGRPLFAKGHPDEYALTLANEVYGGSFGARLNMNLREAKGYTYGASSQNAHRTGVGVFIAYSAIRADVTAEGVRETFIEFDRMRSHPVTADELEGARSGLIRSLPGRFEVTSAMAGAAGSLFQYDLPLDYFAQLGGRYAAVSLTAVRQAALDYLTPESMQILLVGDSGVVGASVEALGLGSVAVED